MKLFSNFIETTREPFEYIANLFGVTIGIIAIYQWATNLNLGIGHKLFGGGLLVVLSFTFLRNSKHLFESFLYNMELGSLSKNLKKIKSLRLVDYDKIIPQTSTLSFLLKKAKILARRWSKDVFLSRCGLVLTNRYNRKFEINLNLCFYSCIKRIELSIPARDLRLPSKSIEKILNSYQMQYQQNVQENKPFFHDLIWRQVLIASLQHAESELLETTFFCSMNRYDPNGISIGILPDRIVEKWSNYYYDVNTKKLYAAIIPSESSLVVADFIKNLD